MQIYFSLPKSEDGPDLRFRALSAIELPGVLLFFFFSGSIICTSSSFKSTFGTASFFRAFGETSEPSFSFFISMIFAPRTDGLLNWRVDCDLLLGLLALNKLDLGTFKCAAFSCPLSGDLGGE